MKTQTLARAAHAIRTMTVALVITAVASPVWSQSESMGVYQSDLDGRRYEVRRRGDTGLEIYSANGATLLATLRRDDPNDAFKGTTHRMATRCPRNSGKIETRGMADDEIRMRVEVAQQPLLGQKGQRQCNIRFGTAWQDFALVLTPSSGAANRGRTATPTAVPPGEATASQVVTQASFDGFDFRVVGAVAQGKDVEVTLSVLNQGTDRELRASFNVRCGRAAELVDDKGKTYTTSLARLGNQNCRSAMLSGVVTTMALTFREMATVAGVLEATEIKRLRLPSVETGPKARGMVEFRNIPIQRAE